MLLLYITATNKLEVALAVLFNFLMVRPKTPFYTIEAYNLTSASNTTPSGIRETRGTPTTIGGIRTVVTARTTVNDDMLSSTAPSDSPALSDVLTNSFVSTRT